MARKVQPVHKANPALPDRRVKPGHRVRRDCPGKPARRVPKVCRVTPAQPVPTALSLARQVRRAKPDPQDHPARMGLRAFKVRLEWMERKALKVPKDCRALLAKLAPKAIRVCLARLANKVCPATLVRRVQRVPLAQKAIRA
jgi:hypothetical protein